jgi:hypothetical protein
MKDRSETPAPAVRHSTRERPPGECFFTFVYRVALMRLYLSTTPLRTIQSRIKRNQCQCEYFTAKTH